MYRIHNNEDRIEYENGADVTVHEKWDMKMYYLEMYQLDYDYIEPDYIKYENLVDEGLCESVTRVIYDEETIVSKNAMMR